MTLNDYILAYFSKYTQVVSFKSPIILSFYLLGWFVRRLADFHKWKILVMFKTKGLQRNRTIRKRINLSNPNKWHACERDGDKHSVVNSFLLQALLSQITLSLCQFLSISKVRRSKLKRQSRTIKRFNLRKGLHSLLFLHAILTN